MVMFAFDNGYSDSILRGLRSSFLTTAHYNQITNLSSLAQLKSLLQDTDYGPYLIQQNSNIPISVLRSKLKRKLADELQYVKHNGCGLLGDFLDLLSIKYQIDNVVNFIQGLKNKVDYELLLANVDPLGYFPQIKNIKVLEGDDYTGLYRDVLIDTPVGPYFMKFLQDALSNSQSRTIAQIQNIFHQMKPQFIRTSLKKIWLQEFHSFCSIKLNLPTQEMMDDLIKFEADFKTIQVVYNSLNSKDVANIARLVTNRKHLCPALGHLYPDREKAMLNATSLDMLKDVLRNNIVYQNVLKDAPDPAKKEDSSVGVRTLDDIMYDQECHKYALAYDQYDQYAVYYAHIKLKQQEIRNIVWMAEMVSRKLPKSHPGWKKIIVPFSHLRADL